MTALMRDSDHFGVRRGAAKYVRPAGGLWAVGSSVDPSVQSLKPRLEVCVAA
jgi:hypothetical protein